MFEKYLTYRSKATADLVAQQRQIIKSSPDAKQYYLEDLYYQIRENEFYVKLLRMMIEKKMTPEEMLERITDFGTELRIEVELTEEDI